MLFSVVIPLYNKAGSISKTIDSVLCQTLDDFEIIVVDDGSTDGGADIVLGKDDQRIRVIKKENGGVCSARNVGILHANADFIAFLDADDVWELDYLREQARMITDFPECSMWGINFAPTLNGAIYKTLRTALPGGFRGVVEGYFEMKCRESDLFCSSSTVVRKNTLICAGMFDERIKYAEDLDIWYRIIARNKVAFYDKIMVYYQHDAENRALANAIPLKQYLPYYVDKFFEYRDCDVFYRFIHNWSAVKIKAYYKNKSTRRDAIDASKNLDYSVLPSKYRKIFCTSYYRGILCYYFYETLHIAKSKLSNGRNAS